MVRDELSRMYLLLEGFPMVQNTNKNSFWLVKTRTTTEISTTAIQFNDQE